MTVVPVPQVLTHSGLDFAHGAAARGSKAAADFIEAYPKRIQKPG
jgi:hypothetical protein